MTLSPPSAPRDPATGPTTTGNRTTRTVRARIDARTLRHDRWWVQPAITVAVLLAFVVYSTWRAFADSNYYSAPYVSPFYSPCLADRCRTMHAGPNADLPSNAEILRRLDALR